MSTGVATVSAADQSPAHARSRSLTLTATVFAGVSVVLLALALLVAVTLPYSDWDALSLGTWSRLIAEHWPTLHFSYAYFGDYQRPLFYVLQGFIWHLFGFHQALGRLLSLAFAVLLAMAVGLLARTVAPPYRRLAAALAIVLLLLLTYFDQYVAAGLTDIPVTAMVALTAVVLCTHRLGRARLPLLAAAACLSVLTKPSALSALAGLGGAFLLGSRAGLRRRAYAVAALCLGVGGGLLYDLDQARYSHVSLWTFLSGYTGSQGSAYYARLADQLRSRVLLDTAWLGEDLRLLLVFALVYAVLRLFVSRHRLAVGVALPVAWVWSWLGPHLAGARGLRVGILGTGGGTEQIAVLVLAASLLLALNAPADAVPDRLRLARLLVWATPTLALWANGYVFEPRALAPAWPPLVLLMTWTLLPAFAGAQRRSEWLVAVPAGAVLVLGLLAAYNLNGLGSSGWRQYRSGGISGLTNAALMRNVALGGDFSAEVNALAPQVGPRDRILTFDGRLRFFYLDQVDLQEPLSCSQLAGHRVFVLLESDEIRAIYGKRGDSAYWDACRPAPTMVDERLGAFAVFVTGAPRPTVGGCGAPPEEQGLAVEFGRLPSQAKAESLVKRLASVGFVQARVEQLGCSLYRVVETGVPDAKVGQSILAEARSAGLAATLVGH